MQPSPNKYVPVATNDDENLNNDGLISPSLVLGEDDDRIGYYIDSENLKELQRTADKIPSAAWFIIVMEFCERFAYYGGSAPFQNYIQFSGDEKQAGALGMGQSMATALQNFFQFACYLTPLLAASLADTHLGRYQTIIIFGCIYLSGWIILTLTSTRTFLDGGWGFPGFIIALVVIGTGTGGIKAVVAPMCADQFPHSNDVICTRNRRKVVIDHEMSVNHLYNYFYFAINVGALLGGLICPQLEFRVGFWAAYLVPTIMLTFALFIFILGTPLYRSSAPLKSISLLSILRCLISSSHRARNTILVHDLNQAAHSCRIFIPLIAYWACYSQLGNNLLSQAASLRRPHWLPNDAMSNFDPIILILALPVLDTLVYPTLCRYGIPFPPILRITLGFFLAAASMFYAAFIQYLIYMDPAWQTTRISEISVFVQIPAYALLALSEALAATTALSYSYTNAPKSMRSIVAAFALLPSAAAAIINLLFSPFAQDPYMDSLYAGTGTMAALVGTAFWFWFRREDHGNEMIPDGNNDMELERTLMQSGSEY